MAALPRLLYYILPILPIISSFAPFNSIQYIPTRGDFCSPCKKKISAHCSSLGVKHRDNHTNPTPARRISTSTAKTSRRSKNKNEDIILAYNKRIGNLVKTKPANYAQKCVEILEEMERRNDIVPDAYTYTSVGIRRAYNTFALIVYNFFVSYHTAETLYFTFTWNLSLVAGYISTCKQR